MKNTWLLQASSKKQLKYNQHPKKTVWKGPTLLVVFTKTSFLLGWESPEPPKTPWTVPKFRNRGIPTSIVVPSTGLGVHAVVLLLKAAASQIKPWCIKAYPGVRCDPPGSPKKRVNFGASEIFQFKPSPQKMNGFSFWGNLSETFQMDGSNI